MKVENINSASSSVYELYLMRLSRFKDDKEQLEMDLEEVKNIASKYLSKEELSDLINQYEFKISKLEEGRYQPRNLKESFASRQADTDDQEQSIKEIEATLDKLGIKYRFGTKIGKYPQTVIIDINYQDNAIYVNSDGTVMIYGDSDGEVDPSDEDLVKSTLIDFEIIPDETKKESVSYNDLLKKAEEIMADDKSEELTEDSKEYTFIKSKSVLDSDGFYTDYSMYKDNSSGKYVMIFGDSDEYNPLNTEADVEFDNEKEARDWFDSYEGFADLDSELDDARYMKVESVEDESEMTQNELQEEDDIIAKADEMISKIKDELEKSYEEPNDKPQDYKTESKLSEASYQVDVTDVDGLENTNVTNERLKYAKKQFDDVVDGFSRAGWSEETEKDPDFQGKDVTTTKVKGDRAIKLADSLIDAAKTNKLEMKELGGGSYQFLMPGLDDAIVYYDDITNQDGSKDAVVTLAVQPIIVNTNVDVVI